MLTRARRLINLIITNGSQRGCSVINSLKEGRSSQITCVFTSVSGVALLKKVSRVLPGNRENFQETGSQFSESTMP